MITNIIKIKSKIIIQQTTAIIDIVLVLVNQGSPKTHYFVNLCYTLFSYFSIFIDYKASKPILMVLTPCRDSRHFHRPKDSSFDSSIGPIVFQKAIKNDLQALMITLSAQLSA